MEGKLKSLSLLVSEVLDWEMALKLTQNMDITLLFQIRRSGSNLADGIRGSTLPEPDGSIQLCGRWVTARRSSAKA